MNVWDYFNQVQQEHAKKFGGYPIQGVVGSARVIEPVEPATDQKNVIHSRLPATPAPQVKEAGTNIKPFQAVPFSKLCKICGFNVRRGSGRFKKWCKECYNNRQVIVSELSTKAAEKQYRRHRIRKQIREERKKLNKPVRLSKNRGGNTFRSRDVLLLELGYKTYKAYLKSVLWRHIKKEAFILKGDKCALCKQSADIIHHRKYDLPTLSGDCYTWLEPLCNVCHRKIEFLPNGQKTTHKKAEMLFKQFESGFNF